MLPLILIRENFFGQYLKDLAPLFNMPWVLLGDFNEMLDDDEKMGGLPFHRNMIATFRDCLD